MKGGQVRESGRSRPGSNLAYHVVVTATTPSVHAHVEQVMLDVACPACDYNLRGLAGPIVACPECGQVCDVAKLVSLRWTQPWHRAPKFNRVVLPVAWAVFGWLTVVLATALAFYIDDAVQSVVVQAVAWLLLLAGWFACFVQSYRVFGAMRGVWLAMLAHAIFLIYLVTLILTVSLGLASIAAIVDGRHSAALVPAVVIATTWGVGYLARRGERWIAEQCIREYLRRKSMASPIAPTAAHGERTEAEQ